MLIRRKHLLHIFCTVLEFSNQNMSHESALSNIVTLYLRFTMKRFFRQKPREIFCADLSLYLSLFKGFADGSGQGCSIGFTSLHAYGGAFYAVTHSQRKYHYPLYVVVAHKPAMACLQCWCSSLRAGIGSPPVPSHPRVPITGSHIQNVSVDPILL